MAKEAVSPEEQALENAKNRTESFFENNSKTVIVALIAIFVLAAAIFGYRKLIVEPRMEKAQEMLYGAQYRFEEQNPDYALALNGDQSAPGFAEVVEATSPATMPPHAACIWATWRRPSSTSPSSSM